MSYLSKDQILSADDLQTRDVEVPEWGGTVRVSALSGKDRDAYEASMIQVRDGNTSPQFANARAKLVGRAIVDEDGKRVFSDSDIIALGGKSAAALSRVFDVAVELSAIAEDSVEQAEGNSDAAQGGDSPSDSPATSE